MVLFINLPSPFAQPPTNSLTIGSVLTPVDQTYVIKQPGKATWHL